MSQSKEKRRRVEAMRAEQARRRRARARRRRITMITAPIAAVVVAVGAMVAVRLAGSDTATATATPEQTSATALTTTVNKITSVAPETLAKAGAPGGDAKLIPVTGQRPLTTEDGKPRILYVGAEYCPYCAAERWPLIVALSRFGTFDGLDQAYSSDSDVFPHTPTFTFRSANFMSKYVSFTPVETESEQGHSLDSLTEADQALVDKLNAPPYVPESSKGSIPFIDLGNKYLISGASYSPDVLKGKTHAQIADALSDPTSEIGKQVDSVANMITAGICAIDGNEPATVCDDPVIKKIREGLGGK